MPEIPQLSLDGARQLIQRIDAGIPKLKAVIVYLEQHERAVEFGEHLIPHLKEVVDDIESAGPYLDGAQQVADVLLSLLGVTISPAPGV